MTNRSSKRYTDNTYYARMLEKAKSKKTRKAGKGEARASKLYQETRSA